ncbi:VOC family protein [Streptomyces sp. NBC_01728]|uniref:VOC family protein n=1 Tax=unclassified Streptomyces TaxID=2593676 RepID=UPI00224F6A45|nr:MULTISPECIES: VOC family protein [unclassified Streptomyces]MCX4459517.1 VOC family protein [Streptomyces sp. NBC_01719]MCX4498875.1 VOC family protein [Streptomyces sp. NBC_01728]
MKSDAALHGEVTTSHSVFGAPCWASLTTRDLRAAEDFYHAVLGWEWRTGSSAVGYQYRVATVHGVPVAGISEMNFGARTSVAWTPYFAVASADETVSRSQERGGTTPVGPISFPPGRVALLADRDGAVFGIWEGALVAGWEEWRRAAPVFVRLHTRDAFDAAIFYAEVLEWASSAPGSCEVHYEDNEVVLRSRGDVVARIHSGAIGAAPGPTIRPHWQIHFTVDDVEAAARATRAHGGTAHQQGVGSTEAILTDPDGARFFVTARTAG